MMIPSDSKGFTLLEVMIAMAIFAIGILGLVKLQVAATLGNTSSRTMSEATANVVGEIEKIINETYDYADAVWLNDEHSLITSEISGVPYNISWEVNKIRLNPPNNTYNVKQIITKVEWSDKGEDKTFSVTTYKSLTSDKGKSE